MKAPQVINEDKTSHYLEIGDVAFLRNEGSVKTTLGSCISVFLYSPYNHVSAICHAQLPSRKSKNNQCYMDCPSSCLKGMSCISENKYLDEVIPYMLEHFASNNIPKAEIRAAVIGGASISKGLENHFLVGKQNIQKTNALLYEYDLPVDYIDTGGHESRKFEFQNKSGDLIVNNQIVFNFWAKRK